MIKNISIKPGYILRELGGEFCIAIENEQNSGAIDGLPSINEAGIFLWHYLEKGCDAELLIKKLMDKFHMDYEDAYEDVGEFLAKLINGKIITFDK